MTVEEEKTSSAEWLLELGDYWWKSYGKLLNAWRKIEKHAVRTKTFLRHSWLDPPQRILRTPRVFCEITVGRKLDQEYQDRILSTQSDRIGCFDFDRPSAKGFLTFATSSHVAVSFVASQSGT